MKIKMPTGVILETPNETIAQGYLDNGGVIYTEEKPVIKKMSKKVEKED